MIDPTRAWVGIGSNVDRERHVRFAVHELRRLHRDLVLSTVYETDAVGFEGEPFYNLVAGFDTRAPVAALVAEMRAIEDRCQRDRGQPRFSPRTLDIDLLLYGDAVLRDGPLDIPRPEIVTCAHVLGPLAEVAGATRHPVSGRTFAELWAELAAPPGTLRPVDIDLEPPAAVAAR